eukprot:scaffold178243_cov31-Tisochrysis_lutea.AAC.2
MHAAAVKTPLIGLPHSGGRCGLPSTFAYHRGVTTITPFQPRTRSALLAPADSLYQIGRGCTRRSRPAHTSIPPWQVAAAASPCRMGRSVHVIQVARETRHYHAQPLGPLGCSQLVLRPVQ